MNLSARSVDNRIRRLLPGGLRLVGWLSIALMLLNVAWRCVRYASNRPLWEDEASLVVSFLERDFAGMLRPLDQGQFAPPGFLWITLAVTRLFGLSEWAVRLLPFLAGLGAVGLYGWWVRRRFGRSTALLAIGFFAAAKAPVRFSAEFKPYGVDLFVALVLVLLGLAVTERPSRGRWVVLAVAGACAVWLSYPSTFVAGGAGLVLAGSFFRGRSRGWPVAFLAYGLTLLIGFASLYLLVVRPQARAASHLAEISVWRSAFPPVGEPEQWLPWLLKTHTGPMFAYPRGAGRGGSVLTLLLVVTGAVALWRTRRALLGLLLSPLLLNFAAAVLHRYPYGGAVRVMLYMAPAFCLLAGVGLAAWFGTLLPRRWRPLAVRIAAAAFAVLALVGALRDATHRYKDRGDLENRRVMEDLAGRTGDFDRWVIFDSLQDVSHAPDVLRWGGSGARFRYYIHRTAPVPVLWGPEADRIAETSQVDRTYVIAYRDNRAVFPQDQWEAYEAALSRRWGPPKREIHPLEGPEAIEVLVFEPDKSWASLKALNFQPGD